MTNKLPITAMLEEIIGELSCKGVQKAFTAGYILGFMEEVRTLEEASQKKATVLSF